MYKYLIAFCFLLVNIAAAQKLPNRQQTSIWAPDKIKIDGKATEWNDQYQAHNPVTGLWYTMANDDQNLYLAAYTTEPGPVFSKILTGGITLIIKIAGQEASLRYPVFPNNTRMSFETPARGQVFTGVDDEPKVLKDNAILTTSAKDIEVKGIKDVDTLLSVFNEFSIKAAARFDNKLGYHYELCLPLKYFCLSAVGATSFKYQILLNGGPNKYAPNAANMPRLFSGTKPDGTPISQSEIDVANAALSAAKNARYATTDFSGEYTLAKKP